jgi:hypothetical protein
LGIRARKSEAVTTVRHRECSFSEFSLKLQFNYDLIKRSSIHHYSPSPL